MSVEIERKFLVDPVFAAGLSGGTPIKQGYLETVGLTSVRARIKGSIGYITIKGESTGDGMSRPEYEYEIPLTDAQGIIETLCGKYIIEKTRYEVAVDNKVWEIDVFHGDNSGLIMAEVELTDVDEPVAVPDWIFKEVTGDVRYYNSRLVRFPWNSWT